MSCFYKQYGLEQGLLTHITNRNGFESHWLNPIEESNPTILGNSLKFKARALTICKDIWRHYNSSIASSA